MSSTTAAAVRNTRSSSGTRFPSSAITAIANAVSVAIGIPQPEDQVPLGIIIKYNATGTTAPPTAAAIGNAAGRGFAKWPIVNSRLISNPITKKIGLKSNHLSNDEGTSGRNALLAKMPMRYPKNVRTFLQHSN